METPIVKEFTKPKRTRKASTPRVRKPKDPGILAIEDQAKRAKEEYREAQASGAILKRILDKMLPRLTQHDQHELYNALDAMPTTPPLITSDGDNTPVPKGGVD